MSDRLRVFVASSSEQLQVADRIADALRVVDQADHTPQLDVCPWSEGVFTFSASYIETLEEELDRADFAVVILTADDVASSRNKEINLPRDNVVLELGLFMGRLGRRRCFFFVDGESDTKVASDLSGVKPVEFYEQSADETEGRFSVKTQATSVRKDMLGQGSRCKPSEETRAKQEEQWRFCQRLSGAWWERMRRGDDDMSALSYVMISIDEVTNTPYLEGKAFGVAGEYLAEWKSIVSGVQFRSTKPTVFYRWEGEFDERIGQPYGGGGRIDFDDVELQHASGYFYDTNYAQVHTDPKTRLKRFGLYRCEPYEAEIMRRHWSEEGKALVRQRLESLQGR